MNDMVKAKKFLPVHYSCSILNREAPCSKFYPQELRVLYLHIDIIDYVTGIGNSSREQYSRVVTHLGQSVSP